eukprot:m.127908 g.127908  ORF g.127908 m.127908 type:complete len:286 (-) comp22265_c0_seq3:1170-2027(-)
MSTGDEDSALSMLVAETLDNLRGQTPAFDDLYRTATKYQAAMEQAASAQQAFLEQLQRVAVWATRARGDTATIGHQLRAVTTAHIAVAATRRDQSARMASELVAPLAKRIKSDTKHMPKMEDEFRQMSRSLKSDLRKAETAAYKAQKQVMKKGDSHQPALSAAVETVTQRTAGYEEFNQRVLRTVLIEERRRFCYVIRDYAAVFMHDFRQREDVALLQTLRDHCSDPSSLPQASAEVIAVNSSQPRQESQPSKLESRPTARKVPRGGVAIDMLRAQQGSSNGVDL